MGKPRIVENIDAVESDIIRLESLINDAKAKTYTAILTSSAWIGNEAPYTQTVSLTDFKGDGVTIIGVASDATNDQIDTAMGGWLWCTEVGQGYVTITSYGGKATIDIPIQITDASGSPARIVNTFSRGTPYRYRLHTVLFTENGTFKLPEDVSEIDVLCVGGGGGVGISSDSSTYGISGGGGGHISKGTFSNLAPGAEYTITIGAAGGNNTSGGVTSFGTLLSANGGNAGKCGGIEGRGGDGGSGGGGAYLNNIWAKSYGGNATFGGGGGGGPCAADSETASSDNPSQYGGHGGNGGTYGGGGGAASNDYSSLTNMGGAKGQYGGKGGNGKYRQNTGNAGAAGTDTTAIEGLEFTGPGKAGAAGRVISGSRDSTDPSPGSGGGGGYGGNGGNGGNMKIVSGYSMGYGGGGGGGGGYGADGGNGIAYIMYPDNNGTFYAFGAGGGGGGYGGRGADATMYNGLSTSVSGGGGGGYGLDNYGRGAGGEFHTAKSGLVKITYWKWDIGI